MFARLARHGRVPLLFGSLLFLALSASAEEWPHWRGPRQDGISRETGLLKSWPATGPKLLWKRDLPGGYSAAVVAGGRLFTQTEDKKEEIVLCLDAATGAPVWEFRYPADYDQHPSLDQRFKSGPRSTPTIEGEHVYALGTTGMLHCLEAKTGKKVWATDLLKLADRKCPEFGYTHSPVIAGDLLFVHPGGSNGNSLAALNKRDGSVVWKGENDPVGYASPVVIEANGAPQVVYFTGRGVVAVTPKEGRPLWRYDWKTDYDLNVATPIFADGQLFISSNYGHGAALLRLKAQGNPDEVYKNLVMQNHFSTSVLYQGHLYGFSNDRLRCVEFATGTMKWDQRGMGRGSLMIADGHLIIQGERGELVLAEAAPTAYTEKARYQALPQGPCWNVPILSDGRLYLRNQETLVALDLKNP